MEFTSTTQAEQYTINIRRYFEEAIITGPEKCFFPPETTPIMYSVAQGKFILFEKTKDTGRHIEGVRDINIITKLHVAWILGKIALTW